MRRFVLVLAFACVAALTTKAQSRCNKTWLSSQRSVTTSVSWDEFLDAAVKLHNVNYFQLPSDVTQDFSVRLTIGNRYTVLYYTEATALASGIEVYDPRGLRLEFEKVYGKQRNNAIELTVEPAYNGVYTFAVRSIYPQNRSACAAFLIREWDDVEWKERLELLDITE